MNLKNKVVVITGGSQGFGKALAESFIFEESRVVISSHDKKALEETSKELSVDTFLADVTSSDDVKKLGEYVLLGFVVVAIIIIMIMMFFSDRQDYSIEQQEIAPPDWISTTNL